MLQEDIVGASWLACLILTASTAGVAASEPDAQSIIGLCKAGADDVCWFSGSSGRIDIDGATFSFEIEGTLLL